MNLRRGVYALTVVFAFVGGVFLSPLLREAAPYATARAESERPDLATFWKAWDLAHEHFVYRDALDGQKLVYGAIRGMIDALGDDGHTRYLTPEDARLERSAMRGQFEGIGAEVNLRGGRPVIVAPLEDSPAERAGVRPGDLILMVDGVDVSSFSLSELVAKVRGPRGTTVRLTLIHPGDTSTTDVDIVRQEIRSRSVSWALVPGTSTGHIRINRFGPNTASELREALVAARGAGALQIVLDLRNNPGGLLHEAVAATSQFLTDGDVLIQENADGERKNYPVARAGIARDIPVVVLINRGSASASEIMAGAIQDHGRGSVVGERSVGTGTVLQPFTLDDGSQIYLGTAQWLTPKGRVIRKVGITPDVVVSMPPEVRPLSPREHRQMSVEELIARQDLQLLEALELLDTPPAELAPAA